MTEQNPTPENEEPTTGAESGEHGSTQEPGAAEAPGFGASEDATEVETDAETEAGSEEISDEELAVLSGQVSADEILADLQRVNAEYANYRKRTEANRAIEKERTVGSVLTALLPILDDLDRAAKHGDLTEGTAFALLAEKLRGTVEKMGLTPFAVAGEAFDPNRHDAIFQQPNAEVTVETVADVVETGYLIGETLLRPAKVVVAIPAE
ncbi:nucleotide exchange factor GrpE [Mycetocola tolaasinivorans]|uniref:Protein GrpE n=1 Tax=Mycetocola tolaasinivorans TaxID=76635 RepID=A0A3L7A663_9MICO|nr:nucleotide exchange factor GrpE [Mycetocola tolaasinivorans]RLP75320.1 nucleotide exchange factor GrpE [Mycetocola tolaasinivorans]